jgi:amino acid permease
VTKFLRWYKDFILPAGLLSALIIGAGMFALPYVFVQAGFLAGFLYLALGAAVFSTLHVMYSEVIEATPGKHRFVGYARIHLGSIGKWISVATVLFGMILTLTVYLILSTSFIKLIFPALPPTASVILFWALGSVVVLMSLNRLANFEFAVTLAMVGIVGTLFVLGFSESNLGSLTSFPIINLTEVLLPYGVVLFSFSGRAAISSVREYFQSKNLDDGGKRLKRAIIWGTLAPAVVYAFFVLAIVWLSPGGVSVDSVSGIRINFPGVLALIGLLGFFVIWTSYFFLGLEARDILSYDLKIPPLIDSVLIVFLPLILYFYSSQNLIWFISLAGGIFLALESIVVILMRRKLKPIGPWAYIIILLLLGGIAYGVFGKVFLPA